ncbi:MAG: aminoacyl-tRNA hydrolase [Porphyromonadaceae bacterium]|nr:MAG: aminoacyl-tRNA hydrolase [Porphyromonadaceae bacterium]
MKCLIAGLGNFGKEYANTRHNIGFTILDAFAEASNIIFTPRRYGDVADYRYKSRDFVLLKPSTYMNLSGNAIRYWLQKSEIEEQNLLVVVDDLALPFGQLRLRKKGSDGGHNGLKHITQILGHEDYARLRFGIGSQEKLFNTIDYVLGEWSPEEKAQLPEKIKTACEIILSYSFTGIDRTMNLYNTRP